MRTWIRSGELVALILVLALGLLVSSPPAFAASTRLVSPTGTDTGNCTVNPCKTIGYAIGQSVSGDIISVAAGTYAEHLVVDRSLTLMGANQGSTFIDGSATGTPVTIGAPSFSLAVSMSRLTVSDGLAATGGGIMSLPGSGFTNAVNLTKVSISDNRASGAAGQGAPGGGVYNGAGSIMQVRSSVILGNSAAGGAGATGQSGGVGVGGGFYNAGTLSIDRSTLSANLAVGGVGGRSAPGGAGAGGGIENWGTLSIDRSTLSANQALGGTGGCCLGFFGARGGFAQGGAVHGTGLLSFTNSTISGNIAKGGRGGSGLISGGPGGAAQGGAILDGSTQTLINSTIAANLAIAGPGGCGHGGCGPDGISEGGGIDLISGSADATNLILATNAARTGPDCNGTVSSGGHNLVGSDSSCSGFTGSGDLVNMDPDLGLLQNNGGPTFTQALLTGSPAINAADDTVCAAPPVKGIDQRRLPRQYDPHCDIGAFEVQPG